MCGLRYGLILSAVLWALIFFAAHLAGAAPTPAYPRFTTVCGYSTAEAQKLITHPDLVTLTANEFAQTRPRAWCATWFVGRK